MRISDWSSDVCSSDLAQSRTSIRFRHLLACRRKGQRRRTSGHPAHRKPVRRIHDRTAWKYPQQRTVRHKRPWPVPDRWSRRRSEEHTSELQSLMRTSYAASCLKKTDTSKRLSDETKIINHI